MKKTILMLKKNGILESKREDKITLDDIRASKYWLVPISDVNPNYVLITPSKKLLFTKAIVYYQLTVIYQLDYNEKSYEELKPCYTEVNSICDLIGLLNSIDKINSVNYTLSGNNTVYDDVMQLGLQYFAVSIMKDNKEIYNSAYVLNGTSTIIYDSYKVGKHFKDIYDCTICSKLFCKCLNICLKMLPNDKMWELSSDMKDTDLIGLPSQTTNTITFLTVEQYKKVSKYHTIDTNLCIYYEKMSYINEMSRLIKEGYSYKEREEYQSKMTDVFYDDSRTSRVKDTLASFLDTISYSEFNIACLHLIYDDSVYREDTDKPKTHFFDMIYTVRLYDKKSINGKEFSFNTTNKVNLIELINIL